VIRRLLIVAIAFASACGGAPPKSLVIGEAAPPFKLAAVGGSTVTLDDLAGEPRIVVFWATWCQPCLAEIPALEAIEAEHPGRVVSIALDEGGESDVSRFLEKRSVPYRVLLGDEKLFARYDGLAIPQTVILDRELTVIAVHRGAVDASVLRREMTSL